MQAFITNAKATKFLNKTDLLECMKHTERLVFLRMKFLILMVK